MFLMTITLAALGTGAAFGADAKAGQTVYDKSCKSCHGADGAGNAGVAKMMKVDMKDLKTVDAASIKKAATEGKGKMKPVASVSAADADNVAAYIQSLKK
jgi:mono/diheme cytochrome c family protein